jgi:hypothetical protein
MHSRGSSRPTVSPARSPSGRDRAAPRVHVRLGDRGRAHRDPAGWAIGHTGRGREFAVALSGAARAVPTLGLVLLYLLVGVVYKSQAAVVAFVILAIPSILAGAYAGFEAIDRPSSPRRAPSA